VTDKQYAELWNWLGEGLHRLHVNSKLLKCWTMGYIIGFISRENARAVLLNRARGTFIVRFSESSPGRLAVSFAIAEYTSIEVGNYLMSPEEARSLPDTVRDYSNLTAVVRVVEPGMENITYAASPKDSTYGTMYSKVHPGQNSVSGYLKTMVSNSR
jgi:signal transducer and activator of transcription 1